MVNSCVRSAPLGHLLPIGSLIVLHAKAQTQQPQSVEPQKMTVVSSEEKNSKKKTHKIQTPSGLTDYYLLIFYYLL